MLSLEKQESYRQRYEEATPGWQPSTQFYQDLVSARLHPGSRVLDLGCGRGGVMERLHGRATLLAGIDPDLDSLLSRRIPGGWVACSRAEALPFPDAAFHLVCCSWVLEHLSDPASSFAEVTRVLVPGGHFVLLTPNARHPLLWASRLLRWTRGSLVRRLYGRQHEDTFPAFYRANSPAAIDRLAQGADMRRVSLTLIGDPTYLALGETLFRLSSLLERLTPPSRRIHLVADYVATS
jgi:ubiquinone/menaquinone biosynthesis C-methylase UbiE